MRLVFIGRVSPVKNLDYALRVLKDVRAPVSLAVYGPAQDLGYAKACEDLARTLPEDVHVSFKGEVANDAVPAILSEADAFFLPTKGENFGHAIFEALSCGVPVLISDETPWRGLEAKSAGYDLPLGDPARFTAAIEAFAATAPENRARLRAGARKTAEEYAASATSARDLVQLVASVRTGRYDVITGG